MKIAITGASGFVGGAVGPYLKSRGYTLTALCRSPESAKKVEATDAATAIALDLFDVAAVTRALAGCDAVVHMAARLEFFGPYRDFHHDNVELTEILLKAAQQAKIKHFVYVGAAAVVAGSSSPQPFVESAVVPERPAGVYGITKALAEKAVLAADSQSMRMIVLRPPMVWSENAPTFDAIADAARKRQFIWINGGRYSVATIHVDNLAAAIDAALKATNARGVYFVGDGENIEFRELITRALNSRAVRVPGLSLPKWAVRLSASVMEILWKILRLRGAPPITNIIVDLIGGDLRIDDSRARRELGYKNRLSIAEGLARCCATKESPATL